MCFFHDTYLQNNMKPFLKNRKKRREREISHKCKPMPFILNIWKTNCFPNLHLLLNDYVEVLQLNKNITAQSVFWLHKLIVARAFRDTLCPSHGRNSLWKDTWVKIPLILGSILKLQSSICHLREANGALQVSLILLPKERYYIVIVLFKLLKYQYVAHNTICLRCVWDVGQTVLYVYLFVSN